MKKTILFFLTAITLSSLSIYGQSQTEIFASTVKVTGWGEHTMLYGFAENDQILFDFEDINGKAMFEIEVMEYPSTIRFSDYKTSRIENKTITIPKTGIYKFRFNNSNIAARFCRVKILRTAGSDETKNFNTNVYWRTVYDTTFIPSTENYLISRDTIVENMVSSVIKVHSSTNLNGNTSSYNFTLPPNTVAWSYYIGVDQSGQEAYEQAVKDLTNSGSSLVKRIPGWGPLAAVALQGANLIPIFQRGEDIDYYLMDSYNANLFLGGQSAYSIKSSKVICDYARMTNPLSGTYYFCLRNDNLMQGVEVQVRVTAVRIVEQWGTKQIQKPFVTSREEPYLKN